MFADRVFDRRWRRQIHRDQHRAQPQSQTRASASAYDTAMSVPRKLTLTLAVLMTAQSLMGLLVPEQYRDVDWIKATWYGNDWLTLIMGVPLLLMSSIRAERGSSRAFLLWIGAVGYAIYNYAFYLLGAALNAFFPLYVICVVLATVVLILTLATHDATAVTLSARPAAPLPLIGGSFVIIGLGLAVVWIGMWAAHVFAGRPTPLDPEAFRLVASLDLSIMVPALVSGGVLLWRRRPWGIVVAAIAGVQGSLYLAVLSINALIAIQRGFAQWPGELIVWGPLTAVTLTLTSLLLASVRPDNKIPRDRPTGMPPR